MTTRVRPGTIVSLAVICGIATSVWSYLQGVGADPLTYFTGIYLDVPAGAFGHGSFASAFIVFVALIYGYMWISDSRAYFWPTAIFVTLGLGVAASGGRSAIAALALAVLIMATTVARRRTGARRLVVFVLAISIGMLASIATVRRSQAQLENAVAALAGSDAALNARFAAWIGGGRLLLANPVFGVGPGGFGYAVWPFLNHHQAAVMIRDPLGAELKGVSLEEGNFEISGNVIATRDSSGELFVSQLGWDKAHNYLLDLGLTAGIPALVLFIAFVIAAGTKLWRSKLPVAQGAALGLISFQVFGLGWFGSITLDPVVWTIIGAALGFATRENRAGSQASHRSAS